MRRYWLCPLTQTEPLRIGEMRITCNDSTELNQFRQRMQDCHPRLLPMFKSHLVLSDDPEQCGVGEQFLPLTSAEQILFDGVVYSLSHCAQSFIERMLSPQEALLHYKQLLENYPTSAWTANQHQWLHACNFWWNEGWPILLLSEEN